MSRGVEDIYVLSDGSETTVREVQERTGLSRVGAWRRLSVIDDIDIIFSKSGDIRNPGYTKLEWISEPVKIAWGTPINPEYLDGVVNGNTMTDRNGKVMTYGERVALLRYRNKLRQKWRDESTTIINKDMGE